MCTNRSRHETYALTVSSALWRHTGEHEKKVCELLRVLQQGLQEEHSHNLVDIERLNGWLTNLVSRPLVAAGRAATHLHRGPTAGPTQS